MSDKNTLQNLTNQTFPEIENEVLQYWKQEKIFERVTEMRKGAPSYRFIDGPPFPNDVPHYGHFLCSVAKDIIPRFHTMKGRSVRRVFGWDCHGLPIEEKLNGKLGIKGSESKQKIEQEIGVNQYIEKCRGLVGENIESWRFYMDKLGRWSDMDNAYKTMDANFGESIMWAFKTLWDKGLIYKGKRTSLYSTDSGTPVSDFEVNMDPDNYKETEDVSIYMKFQLENASVEKLSLATNGSLSDSAILEKVFMLAWTTTPWTLYANFALAINQDEQYTVLKYTNASSENEYLIVAKKLVENVKTVCQKELLNVEECLDLPGKSLVGLKYNQYISELSSTNENDFCIYHGDFVSTEDGTGIVHIAPAYGADDFELGKKFNISDKGSIDDTGHMVVGTFKGRYLRDANLDIAKELLSQGKALKVKAYKHRLPYYRTNNPLIYKTQEGWFVNIQKMKPRMIDLIDTSTWVPENIKEGRWRNTIESSPDWCISRDRYWNTIMPVWVNVENTEDYYIPGSFADLEKYSNGVVVNIDGTYFKKSSDGANTIEMTMHRDKCDDIELFIEGKTYRRIPQVMDCWFDSGSVPFAEYHYPFENVEVFANKPSADFIVEYVGQVRAWFSALFRMSVGLFDSHAFDNVICTGTVAGNDGRKMSKSFGNFVDPKPVFENIGGDAIRLSLVNNGLLLGVDAIVSEETMREQVKVILLPYLNSVKYFELYASDFKYDSNFVPTNATDKWIVAKLNILLSKVESSLQAYDIPNAVYTFQPFLADLSSWYIKVNRDRFVKHDNDALNTLFMVLYRFNLVVAPFIPFISEKFWFVLSKYLEEDMLNDHMESVHMQDFPVVIDNLEETMDILSKVEKVQEIISLGLNFRIANAMPVKQVLASANVSTVDSLDEWQLDLVKQELNVLATNTTIASDPKDESVQLDLNLTDDLKAMGVIREFTSKVQQERKRAGKMVGEIVNIQVAANSFDRDALSKDWNQLKEKLLIDNVEWASGDKLKVEVV